MRGEKAMVGRAVDVWSMGCILIVAIIRAIEGAAALDQFENSKANRYRDDYFYYHNREDSSIQLKPEVTRWIRLTLSQSISTVPVPHMFWSGILSGKGDPP